MIPTDFYIGYLHKNMNSKSNKSHKVQRRKVKPRIQRKTSRMSASRLRKNQGTTTPKATIDLFKQKDSKKDRIYLDANGTTPMCSDAIKSLHAWANCGNPSSSSYSGKEAKRLLDLAIDNICKHCGVSRRTYTVLFTPSASASNSQILQATSKAYKNIVGTIPHIITSSIEHKSLLNCAKHLEENKDIELTLIDPDIYGRINPQDVEAAIKSKKTALISIMAVNNEIGSKNDIVAIGEVAKKHNIAFHCDAVQLFGKERINVVKTNMDAMSASFHKFYGPKGLGLLILSNNLINGYKLKTCPIIFGTQQQGLLGGTENPAIIASGLSALKSTFQNRKEKNATLKKKTQYILNRLSVHLPLGDYKNYTDRHEYDPLPDDVYVAPLQAKKSHELVVLGPPRERKQDAGNTLLLSIVKNKGSAFCNQKLKNALRDAGVIISIGSACNTGDNTASHVIDAIGAPPEIKRGIVRISLNDYTTESELNKFIQIFIKCIDKQIPGVNRPRQITTPKKPRPVAKRTK